MCRQSNTALHTVHALVIAMSCLPTSLQNTRNSILTMPLRARVPGHDTKQRGHGRSMVDIDNIICRARGPL